MIWDVRSRVDTIDEEMLEALREAGCYRIFYGIESGNPEILKTLRKQIDLGRIERIIRKTDEVGISAFGYFLIGSPGKPVKPRVKPSILPSDFRSILRYSIV